MPSETIQRVLEYLSYGDKTFAEITNTLALSDKDARHVLRELREQNLVYKNGALYSLVKKEVKKRTPRKPPAKKSHTVEVLRVIFAIISIGTSLVSVRNTSNYLLETYPPMWAYSISIIMSLFMVSAFSAMVLFWHRKRYSIASVIGFLWLIVTMYSMASTSIGMFNAQKESFVVKSTIARVDKSSEALYNQYSKEVADIDMVILNKQESLDRFNLLIASYDTIEKRDENRKDYNSLAWAISDAEAFIKKQNESKAELNDKIEALVSATPTEVVAPDFYEIIGGLFNISPAMIQFVLSLFIAVFIDAISPMASSLALFLRSKEDD